ncbi:hypothetical protein LBMAG53_11990 [Planctomycetota bacterium]|nr:hypothetical protein LBMAG53_11990 [Planctomycetota bacterium]
MLTIGLDIGRTHVRAVAIRTSGNKTRLVGTASVRRLDDDGGELKPLHAALAEIDAVLNLPKRGVTVAATDAAGLIRFVPTAPLPPDRLAKVLRLELDQHADGNELAADALTLAIGGDEQVHCCIVAQPPTIYSLLVDLRTAGIVPERIHSLPVALANLAASADRAGLPLVTGEGLALIVDIGATSTAVALVGQDRLLACRMLPSGGETFTDNVSATARISRPAAEAMKRSGEFPSTRPVTAIAKTTVAEDDPFALMLDGGESPEPAKSAAHAKPAQLAKPAFQPGKSPAKPAALAPAAALAPPAALAPAVALAPAAASGSGVASTFELDDDVIQAAPAFATTEGLSASAAAPELELAEAPAQDPSHLADNSPLADNSQLADPSPLADNSPLVVSLPSDAGAVAPPGEATMRQAQATFGPELAKAAETFHSQLASSLAWFRAQVRLPANAKLERVWLAGGGAGLAGLDGYLARRMQVPVARVDPFAGITGTVPEHPYEFAAATALALAGQPAGVAIDLRPERLRRAEIFRRHLIWPWIAAVLVIAAGICAGLALERQQAADRETIAAFAAAEAKLKEAKDRLAALDAERTSMAEDLRAIASRIYAGRDFLNVVRVLKELAETSRHLWVVRVETVGVTGDESKPTTDTGTSLVKNKTTTWSDSAIDRGALNVYGFMKYEALPGEPAADKENELRNAFFEYVDKLRAWTPTTGGVPFFRDSKVLWFDIIRPDDKKAQTVLKGISLKQVPAGSMPFKLRLWFQPTDLAAVTAAAPRAAAPSPSKAPADETTTEPVSLSATPPGSATATATAIPAVQAVPAPPDSPKPAGP